MVRVAEKHYIAPLIQNSKGVLPVLVDNLLIHETLAGLAARSRTERRKRDSPFRREKLIERLVEGVAQQPLHETIEDIAADQSIAVKEVHAPSLQLQGSLARMDDHAQRIGNEWSEGKIVIPGKVVNGNAAPGEIFKGAEYIEVIGAYGAAIFDPEIEKIAENVQRCGSVRNPIDKFYEFPLPDCSVRERRPDMGIGNEVNCSVRGDSFLPVCAPVRAVTVGSGARPGKKKAGMRARLTCQDKGCPPLMRTTPTCRRSYRDHSPYR